MRTREIDVVIFNEDIEALDNIDNAIVSVFKSVKGGTKAKLVFEEDRKVTITESDFERMAQELRDDHPNDLSSISHNALRFKRKLFGDEK